MPTRNSPRTTGGIMKIIPIGTRSRQLKLLYEMRDRQSEIIQRANNEIGKIDKRIQRIGEGKSAL